MPGLGIPEAPTLGDEDGAWQQQVVGVRGPQKYPEELTQDDLLIGSGPISANAEWLLAESRRSPHQERTADVRGETPAFVEGDKIRLTDQLDALDVLESWVREDGVHEVCAEPLPTAALGNDDVQYESEVDAVG